MGSKYSTNVTSGYNTTPPADDGSATEANRIKWSTIKTKLADPDKDRNDLVNTDLVEHFDQGPDAKSGAYTTLATDYNTILECTGTITISLGDAGTMTKAYFVTVVNAGAGVITVDLDTAGDSLNGDVAGSLTVQADSAVTFFCNNAADGYYTLSQSNGGITATATEINILDASANDVTDHSGPSFARYWYDGSTSPGSTGFDVDAVVSEGSFEAVGPTGSGAANIWTDMDNISANAKSIMISYLLTATPSSEPVDMILFGRPGSVAWSTGAGTYIAELKLDAGTANAAVMQGTAEIPLDSSDLTFDITWSATGDSARNFVIYYRGFMV